MRRSLLVLLLTTVVLGLTAASAAAQTLDIMRDLTEELPPE
jgi:hypothetical protein